MILLLTLAACDFASVQAKTPPPKEAPAAPAAPAEAAVPASIDGTVVENIAVGAYTYSRVRTSAGTEVWAAAPGTPPGVGAAATVPTALPMADFHSAELKRDFPLVYFAETITPAAAGTPTATSGAMPDWHPKLKGDEECGPVKVDAPANLDAAIAAAAASGGATVEKVGDIWARRAELSGRKVSVVGQVVKATAGVMGKTWLHVQDGSGVAGANDLTVTTQESAAVGDNVVVTGIVAVDQDYGYGYAYPVILTEASVTLATAGT